MKTIAEKSFSTEKPIYTLVQSATNNFAKLPKVVAGSGSDVNDKKAMKGRAKRKSITQKTALSLVDIAIKKKDTEKLNSYWNTFHCQNKITVSNNRLYGKYCKNRFCTICNSIRKAEIINKYLPIINTWEEPYFVTLTVKACFAKSLPKIMNGCIRAFTQIKNKYKKRNQRGKGIHLIGVKSLECNFNPLKRTYNPHFHIIVPNKEIAEILVKEWLSKWTIKYTNAKAQHIRKVEDTKRDMVETIKYGSKIFTEPDPNNKTRKLNNQKIYVAALDNILTAMKGKRLFERFGFNLPENKNKHEANFTVLKDYLDLEFNPKLSDWESIESDDVLTSFIPDKDLLTVLQNNIDSELE